MGIGIGVDAIPANIPAIHHKSPAALYFDKTPGIIRSADKSHTFFHGKRYTAFNGKQSSTFAQTDIPLCSIGQQGNADCPAAVGKGFARYGFRISKRNVEVISGQRVGRNIGQGIREV